jgi:tetratricopeptide (TPR) repeat protein
LKHKPGATTLKESEKPIHPRASIPPSLVNPALLSPPVIMDGGSYYRPRYVPPVPTTLQTAKILLQKALMIHPQYSEACYLLGVCCMYESDLESAVKHIQRSILMDPFYVDAYFDLANIFMRLCRFVYDEIDQEGE